MSSKTKPLALALGAALAGGLVLTGSAFAMQPLARATWCRLGRRRRLVRRRAQGRRRPRPPARRPSAEGKCGVAKMDTDKDGKVSKAEFAAAHEATTTASSPRTTPTGTASSAPRNGRPPRRHEGGVRRQGSAAKASAAKASAAKASAAAKRVIAVMSTAPAATARTRPAARPAGRAAGRRPPGAFDFLECAPDNWIGVGGALRRRSSRRSSSRHPLTCHGLVAVAGRRLRRWTRPSSTASRASSTATRRAVQRTPELLQRRRPSVRPDADPVHRRGRAPRRRPHPPRAGRPRPPHRGRERQLLRRAATRRWTKSISSTPCCDEADCDLLLDVNNIYVNAINHGYDAARFPGARCRRRASPQYHIAGHYDEADDLKVDTHGAPVKDDVWALLDACVCDCTACARPCSNATSISRRCRCCWPKWSASASCSARRDCDDARHG